MEAEAYVACMVPFSGGRERLPGDPGDAGGLGSLIVKLISATSQRATFLSLVTGLVFKILL